MYMTALPHRRPRPGLRDAFRELAARQPAPGARARPVTFIE